MNNWSGLDTRRRWDKGSLPFLLSPAVPTAALCAVSRAVQLSQQLRALLPHAVQVKEEAAAVAAACGADLAATAIAGDAPLRAAAATAGQLVVTTPAKLAQVLREGIVTSRVLQDRLQVGGVYCSVHGVGTGPLPALALPLVRPPTLRPCRVCLYPEPTCHVRSVPRQQRPSAGRTGCKQPSCRLHLDTLAPRSCCQPSLALNALVS